MPLMRIGQLSRQVGVSVPAIRYYEELGLLHTPPRSSSGHRSYGPEVLKRLRFIQKAQALSFRLSEIRSLFQLADEGRCPCERAKHVLAQHAARLKHRIKQERRLVRQIERAMAHAIPRRRPKVRDGICYVVEKAPNTTLGRLLLELERDRAGR